MEYYYQWPISKESLPMPEHKKCDGNFWGKSARCMRRRGLCLPPSNYFPRGHRPQMNSPPFRSYDPSWKPLVPDNHPPCRGRDFERPNKASSGHTYKKRPCQARGSKKTFKPCDIGRGYCHDASIPGRCFRDPLINDPYFNAFGYQHHVMNRGNDMSYDPYLNCQNGYGRFCETSAPMAYVEEGVKSAGYSGNCDDLLSTAVKVAIEEPLTEQVDFSVPAVDTCDLGVELSKDEAEAAAQTLEQLFPSLRFSNSELPETHEFLNPTGNSTALQEEPKKEGEQEPRLLPPAQSSPPSIEKQTEQQVKIESLLEDAKPLTESSVTQDSSVQFLANQNQFLSDVLSQFMSGGFDVNQDFLEGYKTAGGIQNVNAANPDGPSQTSSISASENFITEEEIAQVYRPCPSIGESFQCRDESIQPYKTTDLNNFESDINSSIDWDSLDYLFGKSTETKCEDTTQSSSNTTQELSFNYNKPNYSTFEDESLRCVNPNAILKDKRGRKKVKRVITNVEVKTKRVRQSNKKGSKDDEEETVQSMCKTDVYTSTEESYVHEFQDAQTQAGGPVVVKVDAETQWYDDHVESGKISQHPSRNTPLLNKRHIDVAFNNNGPEYCSMPSLEKQNISKYWNGEENHSFDSDVSEFKRLEMSRRNWNKGVKEEKYFESEIEYYKIHDGSPETPTANNQNSTEVSRSSTEFSEDFFSDVLNSPMKPRRDEQDVEHSDSFEVAAYEVFSEDSVSLLYTVPAKDASDYMTSKASKPNESILKSFKAVRKLEGNFPNEQKYKTQTEGIEKRCFKGLFRVDEKDFVKRESAEVLLHRKNLEFDMFETETMHSEDTSMEEPSMFEEKDLLEIKNTQQENSIDRNEESLPESKVDIFSLAGRFQDDQVSQSSSRSKPGRPRKKRAPNLKSRKTVRPSKTSLPQEIVIPEMNSMDGSLDSELSPPPSKKRRLASLRCRS